MPVVRPLHLGVTENVVVLDLPPGTQYKVFASAVDNVGNRRPLEEDVTETVVVIDVPVNEALCPNNCSDRGNCSNFGTCQCEPGYFGSDCSLGNIIKAHAPAMHCCHLNIDKLTYYAIIC